MNRRIRQPIALVGAAMLALALLWTFRLQRPWTQRLTPGWSHAVQYVGTQTWADSVTGKVPDRDVLAEYERGMRLVSEEQRPHSVVLEDRLTLRDVHTDAVTWEFITRLPVDPLTGEHLTPAYAGDVAVFPRNVERRTYRLRSNYVKGIPLAFQRDEKVLGLSTYLFSYKGAAEYSESYSGSEKYPGITVGPGREVRCADEQFYYRAWVEPATGSLVKVEEGCPSGDFIVDTKTDSVISAVDRWSGITSGDALRRTVDEARRERTAYMFASLYLPLCLALIGMGLLVASIARPRFSGTGSTG